MQATLSEREIPQSSGLSSRIGRLITSAVTAHRNGVRVASPCLVGRLRKLEQRARSCADLQTVQILASARRLLGDNLELPAPRHLFVVRSQDRSIK